MDNGSSASAESLRTEPSLPSCGSEIAPLSRERVRACTDMENNAVRSSSSDQSPKERASARRLKRSSDHSILFSISSSISFPL
eukprot:7637911-Pyramimonas_sp.AAC.1